MTVAPGVDASALTCRNCAEPLTRLTLRGHYGRPVDIDDCRGCHLLWFDGVEASRLSGSGMIDLIREMAAGHAVPHRALRHDLGCARCAGPVRRVVNRSRFGRAEQLECRHGHGAWHSYGQWLTERGFVRPVTSADIAAMARDGVVRQCFNCGAPAGPGDGASCGWCGAAAMLMDVGRLLRAVDPEGATRAESTAVAAAAIDASCHACGDPGTGADALRCRRCGTTRMAGDLRVALQALTTIEPALRAHEVTPAAHVRARRMASLDGDLPRRRETVRVLEQQARGGGGAEPAHGRFEAGGGMSRLRMAAWAFALAWLAWAVWGRG